MSTDGITTALNESTRTYLFASRNIGFQNVTELIVRASGTHRLKTADGKLHVVQPGWLAITIEDEKKEWTK